LLDRLRVPPVSRRLRSYSALRLPDPLRPQLRFPLLSAYLLGECFFLAGQREHPLPRSRRSLGQPALRLAGALQRSGQGLPGFWTVPSVRATVEHPARCAIPLPPCWLWHCCLPVYWPLGHLESPVSRPHSRGSHARRPTLRRYGYPHRRKALLPACRARLWPGGVLTHWTTYRISVGIATSFLSDQTCLVASNISLGTS